MRNIAPDSLHIAVGVIRDAKGGVLLSRRHEDAHQGGLWEFPGGKCEPGEPVAEALARELGEELGIRVTAARPLIQIRHAYPDRRVLLHVFEVTRFEGEPIGRENQTLVWAAPITLDRYPFPAANGPILTALRLPPFYPVLESAATDARTGDDQSTYRRRFHALLDQGERLIYWRARNLAPAVYRRLAKEFSQTMGAKGGCLMIRADSEEFAESAELCPRAGLHLSGRQLHTLSTRPAGWRWVGAACHSLADLRQAQALGLDFAVLSPISITATHPRATPLGWEAARRWLGQINLPVYLMGGLARSDLDRACLCGARGVAGIRLFLD
ncbi:MAG: Nudix family hydrolase [Methylothermaceae bacterium]|nr:Nudix family hydrolase [Methylothermaceae bacterium]